MDIATEEEEQDVFFRFSYMLAKSSSMSSSSWLRVVRSFGQGTPQCTVNQLQVELLANVGWKYWQMNKFQYVSNGRFFPPTTTAPRGNDFSSRPQETDRRSVCGWRLVRCYVGRSFSPSLANVCRCYLSFHLALPSGVTAWT